MTLNVKATMLISTGCIVGVSWALQGVDIRETIVPSPLVIAGAGGASRYALGAAGAPGLERRAAWARQFDRPSAMEREASSNRSAAMVTAIAVPLPEMAVEPAPVTLPPLAYVDPEPVDGGLAPVGGTPAVALGSEAPPATTGEVVTASADGGAAVEVAIETPDAVPALRNYRVVKGDTLSRIARRECGSAEAPVLALLMELNPRVAARNGRVNLGESLVVPAAGAVSPTLAARATPADTASGERWYTIQRNDSLTSIAKRFLGDGGHWPEIVKLNGNLNPKRLVPGTQIKLPMSIKLARN